MKSKQAIIQVGKNGLTGNLVETIKKAFNGRENVKVHLLKSSGHKKEKTKEIADEIVGELGKKYTYRIVGFTIFLKKWRKPRR